MRNKRKAVRGIFLAAVMMSMAACGNAEETVSSGNPEAENVSEKGTEETTTDGEESREASASAEDQEEAPASEEESEESSVSSGEAEESTVSSEESEEESASTEEPEDKVATDGSPQGAFPVKMTLYKEEKPSDEYLFDEEGYAWKLVGEGYEWIEEYLTDNGGNKLYGHMDPTLYGGNWDDEREVLVKSYTSETNSESGSSSFEYNEENNIVSYSQDFTNYNNNGMTEIHRWFNYVYEETGEGRVITCNCDWGQDGDKSTYVVQLDGNGNVVSRSQTDEFHTNGIVDVYEYEDKYEYDNDGNMVKHIRTDDQGQTQTDSYTYDGAGNRLSHTWEGGKDEYEGYNGDGNWTLCTRYDENGELVLFNSRDYNEDGNIICESLVMGTDELTVNYEYDEEGRMLSASLGDQILQQLDYNAEGLLEKITGIYDFEYGLGGYWMYYRGDIADWVQKYTGIKSGHAIDIPWINAGETFIFEY